MGWENGEDVLVTPIGCTQDYPFVSTEVDLVQCHSNEGLARVITCRDVGVRGTSAHLATPWC